MAWLCHLMDPAYLYSTGRPWPGLPSIGVMILLTLVGVALTWWCSGRLRRQGRRTTIIPVATAGLSLGLVIYLVGPYSPGPLSARVVYLAPSTLGLALPLLALGWPLAWPSALQPPLRALACDLHPEDVSWVWWIADPLALSVWLGTCSPCGL